MRFREEKKEERRKKDADRRKQRDDDRKKPKDHKRPGEKPSKPDKPTKVLAGKHSVEKKPSEDELSSNLMTILKITEITKVCLRAVGFRSKLINFVIFRSKVRRQAKYMYPRRPRPRPRKPTRTKKAKQSPKRSKSGNSKERKGKLHLQVVQQVRKRHQKQTSITRKKPLQSNYMAVV